MKLSTRARYGLKALIDLGLHSENETVSLQSIAERQDISKKYLEQIIPYLNRGRLLLTNRGHQGGYKLAKHPSEITVYDVLECAEGDLAPVSCLQNESEPCERRAECLTLPIWRGLDEVVKNYLKGITLKDALNNRPDAPEYSI